MKRSTLHQIAGVLVTAGRSDLAQIVTQAETPFEKLIKIRKFRHPKTKRQVKFGSLPPEEQKKVRKQFSKWSDKKGAEEEKEGGAKKTRSDITDTLKSAGVKVEFGALSRISLKGNPDLKKLKQTFDKAGFKVTDVKKGRTSRSVGEDEDTMTFSIKHPSGELWNVTRYMKSGGVAISK